MRHPNVEGPESGPKISYGLISLRPFSRTALRAEESNKQFSACCPVFRKRTTNLQFAAGNVFYSVVGEVGWVGVEVAHGWP